MQLPAPAPSPAGATRMSSSALPSGLGQHNWPQGDRYTVCGQFGCNLSTQEAVTWPNPAWGLRRASLVIVHLAGDASQVLQQVACGTMPSTSPEPGTNPPTAQAAQLP